MHEEDLPPQVVNYNVLSSGALAPRVGRLQKRDGGAARGGRAGSEGLGDLGADGEEVTHEAVVGHAEDRGLRERRVSRGEKPAAQTTGKRRRPLASRSGGGQYLGA